ncbi:hypothetical protein I7I51_00547 [Histoplasma capsulatum]|uniref:Uncharacterized protein n=1 Tax=Ajellomyces capsulatus TaxID=5037 RepID=A0A8A1MC21_AJECA|nr:hypothetical protein I7I51_00547 [Histoplasma capsulatum]
MMQADRRTISVISAKGRVKPAFGNEGAEPSHKPSATPNEEVLRSILSESRFAAHSLPVFDPSTASITRLISLYETPLFPPILLFVLFISEPSTENLFQTQKTQKHRKLSSFRNTTGVDCRELSIERSCTRGRGIRLL